MTRRDDDDFRAEIEAHIELETDQLIDEGVAPEEARKLARRRFGNVTRTRERFHESSRWMALDHLRRNAGYALRQMRAAPVSSLAVLLSLALGIGLSTSILTVADQVAFRPLPVEDPSTLVQLQWDGEFVVAGMGGVGTGHLIPYPLFEQVRDELDVFDDVFARAPAEVHVGVAGSSSARDAELVSGSTFEVLGVRPRLGRLLDESDDVAEGNHPVAVLSHGFWLDAFGGREDALGEVIHVNGQPLTVVGVVEPGFHGTDWSLAPALWAPMAMKESITGWSGLDEPRSRFAHVFARLAPGVTREQAQTRIDPWFAAYLHDDVELPSWPSVGEDERAAFLQADLRLLDGSRGQARLGEQVREPMLILVGAAALIFLLACLNVTNLSLARVLAARRATALRAALGASRRRIVGESLVESALFALLGAALGALLAPLLTRGMVALLSAAAGGATALDAGLDATLVMAALVLASVVTVLSGTAPALFASSTRPTEALQQRSDASAAGLRLRKVLVVGQCALALVLLVAAGLFAETLRGLRLHGPGYSTERMLTFQIAPRRDGFSLQESKAVTERLLEALQARPEIEGVAVTSFEMLGGGGWGNPVTIDVEGRRVTTTNVTMNSVNPDFFDTLGTPILHGRAFLPSERVDEGWGIRSVIVNQELVDRFLDGEDPLGARLAFGTAPDVEPMIEIVGVVQSFRDWELRETRPSVFFPLWQSPVSRASFVVRTRTEPGAARAAVRSVVEAEPGLTMLGLRSVGVQLDRMLLNERMLARLASLFAVAAGVLALVGLHGVLAFSAERRTHEIGVRLALGARRWAAGGLIVREAAVLAGLGLALALPATWGLSRVVESQLYGVAPMEPSVIVGAAAILLVAGTLASLPAARRLGRVDPLRALRSG